MFYQAIPNPFAPDELSRKLQKALDVSPR